MCRIFRNSINTQILLLILQRYTILQEYKSCDSKIKRDPYHLKLGLNWISLKMTTPDTIIDRIYLLTNLRLLPNLK